MSADLISVIMPAYNAGQYIAEAIDSVIRQTHTNWELIIVDDGSNDDTVTIAKEFTQRDHRIQYAWQQQKGQGAARNNGLQRAKGNYLAFLDADDGWLPEKLEKQLAVFLTNNVDLVFSDAYLKQAKESTREKMNIQPGIYRGEEGVLAFLRGNRIPMLTVMVRESSLHNVNGFSEWRDIHEDYDLWLRMLAAGGTLLGIETPLAWYRNHPQSSSSGEGKMMMLDINTLQRFGANHPQYKPAVEHSIIYGIKNYLACNNISNWKLASQLIETKNNLDSDKVRLSSWRLIYSCLGKNIFRMLFHLKWKGKLDQSRS